MKRKIPTIDEWNQLYDAAVEFKKAECWDWMYDNDIFGVKDPKSGEIAYCCIMGNNGELFGIAAYLGSEGLEGALRLLSGEADSNDPENLFLQKCLMCTFEDRNALAPEDLKLIRDLGLKFRGKNEWPVFRHYEPGFFPWFIDSDQCRFLTHILRQALDVSLQCKKNKKILHHTTPYTFLVRVPEADSIEDLSWKDTYLTAKPSKREYVSFNISNDIHVKRLLKYKTNRGNALEVDTFFTPAPVKDKDRPYYPKTCIFLDHVNGMIVSFEMLRDIRSEGWKCVEQLAALIEKNGMMPSKLLVSREETYHLFSEVCKQLGINLEMVDRLDYMEEARCDMFNFFQR